jgi:hypothetical protein
MTSTFIAGVEREVKGLDPDAIRSWLEIWRTRESGDPGLIRTGDLRFRKPTLYPSELRGHFIKFKHLCLKTDCRIKCWGPFWGHLV